MSASSIQTFSAIAVGVFLAAISNGVLVLQIGRYFSKPNKDPLFMRILILLAWLATIAHLFLGASILYFLTITNYGKPLSEMTFPLAFPTGSGLGAFIHTSVQSIYTYRLYKLRGRWLFPVICWTLSAYVLGSGIAYAVAKSTELTAALLASTRWNWLFYSHFSANAGVDILIAGATSWSLIESRDDCYLKKTRRLVNRVLLRTVQAGVVTSVVSVCVVVVFSSWQSDTYWLGLHLPLTTCMSYLSSSFQTNDIHALQCTQ
ncbi:hypothetical protein BD779DRAFT_552040 [Infundibulicybe gibba]|nr:hypothetical protein BD779DRAFT_552040 [Infundibulicybe gibba]